MPKSSGLVGNTAKRSSGSEALGAEKDIYKNNVTETISASDMILWRRAEQVTHCTAKKDQEKE